MAQLWLVNGNWLNIEQIRAINARKENEKESVPVIEEITPVEDVIAVDDKFPEKTEDGFIESELAELSVADLREIAKNESIRVQGQPSKLTLIKMLMKKNG